MGHPNILQPTGLVVADQNEVQGMLAPFVRRKPLREVIECGLEPKSKWTAQFLDAIDFVHNNDIVWNDAKPDNILVDSQGALCLIDFEGDCTEEWVLVDLHDTKEGGKVAVPKILSFIESLGCDPN
ncbi:Serine/threonine-protein kinase Sgk1 [Gracilariopsis chorda]|uniref:Serine/threonine-protein kinase Sgk1 n=1 Tax=Gracilariopsis chorda TaxID=448386 RepID=A0A2V3INC4_9FLOR|nr:Serine/threonine-protein kinase Sgk1 [Gracilariopsis chorda]|eukprot:PXF43581.1 Serine/threonine-protein kinase Sgk1 [Gracilariopsis chorda]